MELELNVLDELLHQAEKQILLVILDACRADRGNTVYRGERSAEGHRSYVLAPVTTGSAGARDSDIHILQACGPGQVAKETLQGGYLTRALLEHIADPVPFEMVLKKVIGRVQEMSHNEQRPRFDMGGAQTFSLSSSHNYVTSVGQFIINQDVDRFVREEMVDERIDVVSLLHILKEIGIRTLADLKDIKAADLTAHGMREYEARQVQQKRPTSAKLQLSQTPQQPQQGSAMPSSSESVPAPSPTSPSHAINGQHSSPQAQGQ